MKKKIDKKRKGINKKFKGLTFADAVRKLEKKYPDREVDRLQRSAFKLAVNMLQRKQELKKKTLAADKAIDTISQMQDTAINTPEVQLGTQQFAYGGFLDELFKKRKTKSGIEPLSPIFNVKSLSTAGSSRDPEYIVPAPPKEVFKVSDKQLERAQETMARSFTPSSTNPDFMAGAEEEAAKNKKRKPLEKVKEFFTDNVYGPAVLGQIINTGINTALLSGGYDKYAPIENPNKGQVLDLLSRSRMNDTALQNRILSAFNKARAQLDDVRSSSVQRALEANLAAREAAAGLSADAQVQQSNIQADRVLANALATFGAQDVQARERARQLTMQTKANYQTGISQLGASISDSLAGITDIKANTLQQEIVANILDKRFRTFGVDKKTIKRALNGDKDAIELIRVKTGQDLSNIVSFNDYYNQEKEKKNKK